LPVIKSGQGVIEAETGERDMQEKKAARHYNEFLIDDPDRKAPGHDKMVMHVHANMLSCLERFYATPELAARSSERMIKCVDEARAKMMKNLDDVRRYQMRHVRETPGGEVDLDKAMQIVNETIPENTRVNAPLVAMDGDPEWEYPVRKVVYQNNFHTIGFIDLHCPFNEICDW
jgi:hypothetical protein